MKATVFGATGVVGRALLPLLGEHEVTAVSRSPRDDPGPRWVVADAATGRASLKRWRGRRSPTTSSIRSGRATSSNRTAPPRKPSHARPRAQG